MLIMKEIEKARNCVLIGCNNKAVGLCNNCGIPVCNTHGKRINQIYLCINCFDYAKRLQLIK